jgi:hypothetical protein
MNGAPFALYLVGTAEDTNDVHSRVRHCQKLAALLFAYASHFGGRSEVDPKQPVILPAAREDANKSADESNFEVIDDYESVEMVRTIEFNGSADAVDALGRPRLVRKPR